MIDLRQLPQVHLYGQPIQHEDAFVIGNRAGLEALRNAIDAALCVGANEALSFAADGEGYGIKVIELCDALMDDMPLPYTDPEAKEMFAKPMPDPVREFIVAWKRRAAKEEGQ